MTALFLGSGDEAVHSATGSSMLFGVFVAEQKRGYRADAEDSCHDAEGPDGGDVDPVCGEHFESDEGE